MCEIDLICSINSCFDLLNRGEKRRKKEEKKIREVFNLSHSIHHEKYQLCYVIPTACYRNFKITDFLTKTKINKMKI